MRQVNMTEKDFLAWLQEQIGKRELSCGYRFEKEELKRQLYDILFLEHKMTVLDVEQYFIPFGQSGYLSARNKFEIMCYVLKKDGFADQDFLFETLACEDVITEEEVERIYLQWSLEDKLLLSAEEKIELFLLSIFGKMECGVLELLQQIAKEGVLLGELCPALYEGEPVEERIALCQDGKLLYLPFLCMADKEELIRIIRRRVAMENKGELTVMDPIWDCVTEDGTCITAVRPPAGSNWGIRILYSAAGKEKRRWQI